MIGGFGLAHEVEPGIVAIRDQAIVRRTPHAAQAGWVGEGNVRGIRTVSIHLKGRASPLRAPAQVDWRADARRPGESTHSHCATWATRGPRQAPKIDHPSRFVSRSSAMRPRCELPDASRPGDHTAIESGSPERRPRP